MHLTAEQRTVFRDVLRGLDHAPVQTVGGLAGTGKTVLVQALAEALPGFAPCAFTGKAAHVLRGRGVPGASTLHSLIYHRPETGADGSVHFERKDPDQVRCRGFLVDEASMISRSLYSDITSYGRPVVFVGDHGQLEPVGEDVNLMKTPDYCLETVHRNAGPVARFAGHLRAGLPAHTFPGGPGVHLLDHRRVREDVLRDADQLLVGFNRTRVAQNAYVRQLLGRGDKLEVCDRVVCLRNSREWGLFNGQQGTVTDLDDGGPTLDFKADDGSLYRGVPYDPSVFGQEKPILCFDRDAPLAFDFAYAVTCHKAQGSEWDSVFVLEQTCPKWDQDRWNYTAASRARKRLWWAGDMPVPRRRTAPVIRQGPPRTLRNEP
jgi:exodeoxyribonuclease-5